MKPSTRLLLICKAEFVDNHSSIQSLRMKSITIEKTLQAALVWLYQGSCIFNLMCFEVHRLQRRLLLLYQVQYIENFVSLLLVSWKLSQLLTEFSLRHTPSMAVAIPAKGIRYTCRRWPISTQRTTIHDLKECTKRTDQDTSPS